MLGSLRPTVRASMSSAVLVAVLFGTSTPALCEDTFEGCSWTGPGLDWTLNRTLPPVDLAGPFSSAVVMRLHEFGVPISFFSETAKDPDVRFQRSEPTTVRELLDEVMPQIPDYRLELVSGKLVIYPLDSGYDAPVDLGDTRDSKRAAVLFWVLRELRSKSPKLHGVELPTLRGPFGGFYGTLVSVGGVRTVAEHLVSLVARSPSVSFVIFPGMEDSLESGFLWADVIDDFFLETPEKVEAGRSFQVTPRLTLVDGTSVTLIGSGCGVYFDSNDESIIAIDQGGRATATGKGTAWLQAKYEGSIRNVEIRVD